MRNELSEYYVQCPYCWQSFEITVDCSVERQVYTEDCEVCCRPILLDVHVDEFGGISVDARNEND